MDTKFATKTTKNGMKLKPRSVRVQSNSPVVELYWYSNGFPWALRNANNGGTDVPVVTIVSKRLSAVPATTDRDLDFPNLKMMTRGIQSMNEKIIEASADEMVYLLAIGTEWLLGRERAKRKLCARRFLIDLHRNSANDLSQVQGTKHKILTLWNHLS